MGFDIADGIIAKITYQPTIESGQFGNIRYFKLLLIFSSFSAHVLFNAVRVIVYVSFCRLEVAEHMVIPVYKTASLLKVVDVAEACSKHLAQNLTLQNCLGTLTSAYGYPTRCRRAAYVYQPMSILRGVDHVKSSLYTLMVQTIVCKVYTVRVLSV